MICNSFLRRLSAVLFYLCIAVFQPLYSMHLSSSDWNYHIDLPDDFTLTDRSDKGDRYLFSSSILPVNLLISAYKYSPDTDVASVLHDTLSRLHGTGDISVIQWRNRDCAISNISLNFSGKEENGWSLCAELPQMHGFLLVMGYYPSGTKEQMLCETSIISALDSVSTDAGALKESGPMTLFAYPSEGDIEVTATIRSITITALMDKSDATANQYVVEREYTLLRFESEHGYGQEACKRFYRMVFRDAGKRLRKFSFAVQNELTAGISTKAERFQLAQDIVQWTQGFSYTRDLTGSDFASLPALAAGSSITTPGGDCDSRALLVALMLHQMNYRTVICISSEYSHAVVGIDVEGNGTRITSDEISYLLGETTKKVSLGVIDNSIKDMKKWMTISFYMIE